MMPMNNDKSLTTKTPRTPRITKKSYWGLGLLVQLCAPCPKGIPFGRVLVVKDFFPVPSAENKT
jgi:hypothetical protein